MMNKAYIIDKYLPCDKYFSNAGNEGLPLMPASKKIFAPLLFWILSALWTREINYMSTIFLEEFWSCLKENE